MIIKLYPENPNPDHIRRVTWVLEEGGIVIYPTDTIYAMGCDIKSNKAIEKIARFKGLNPGNPDMSMIFSSMSSSFRNILSFTIITCSSCLSVTCRDLLLLLFMQTTRFLPCSSTGRKRWESVFLIIILRWKLCAIWEGLL